MPGLARAACRLGPIRSMGHRAPTGPCTQQQVAPEKEEEIASGGNDLQPRGPAAHQELETINDPCEQRQPLDLDRQDEEKKQLKIRIQVCKGEKDRTRQEGVRSEERRVGKEW